MRSVIDDFALGAHADARSAVDTSSAPHDG
jgi:hypothetical protein